MKNDPKKLLRFPPGERANHWLTAIAFVLLALSGLSLYYPAFFPLSDFFGGGVWTRVVHPFIGLVMLVSFGLMFVNYRQLNLMTPNDWQWLGRIRDVMAGNARDLPAMGKFNAGQKALFWLQAACMILLLLSGIVIWRATFASLFPVGLIRFAAVIHALAATIMIGLIIIHIYAAVWTRETLGAMLYGRVRRAWAKQHHPLWFKQMMETTGGDK